MMQSNQNKEIFMQKDSKSVTTEKKPNESLGYYFSSSIKITDPQTGAVLVQKRCD